MFRAALTIALVCGCSASTSTPSGSVDAGPTKNIQFAAMCTLPAACGGDPRGNWTIVGGCTNPSTAGWCDSAVTNGTGTITGTYTIGDGGYTFQHDRSTFACGERKGSGRSTSAGCTITGSRIAFTNGGGVDFCVEGDNLTIIDVNATYPELAVVKLTRKVETADAAP